MTDIRVIIDQELKTDAEILLGKLDLTMSQAVHMFLKQIVRNQTLPFNPYNEKTIAAIKRSKKKKNLTTYKSTKSMFKEWDKN